MHGTKRKVYVCFSAFDGGWYSMADLEPCIPESQDPFELLRDYRFGDLENLRWRLLSTRMSGNLSNHVYSMEITQTDFFAYQFKPVLRLLESPSKGILIADEVGLGKTIEAGLIWTELRARFAHSKLVVLCPSFLVSKWHAELRERFGVECVIATGEELHDTLKKARSSPAYRSFAVIVSFEGARRNEDLIELLQTEAVTGTLIDCLIVDEVHVARNPKKLTRKLTQALRDSSEYAAFLSATPIMLKSEDLFHQLNMLDSFTYSNKDVFDFIVRHNAPLIELRSDVLQNPNLTLQQVLDRLQRRNVAAFQEKTLFCSKSLEALERFLAESNEGPTHRLSPRMRAEICERLDYSNMNSLIVNRTRRREAALKQCERVPHDVWIDMTSDEARLYDIATKMVSDYADEENLPPGFLQNMPQRQMSSSIPATLLRWAGKTFDEAIISDALEDVPDTYDADEEEEEVLEKRRKIGVLEAAITEDSFVQECMRDVESFIRSDTKYGCLIAELRRYLEENPGDQIVLFSYFTGTLDYLEARLKRDGIGCIKLHGQLKTDKASTSKKKKGKSKLKDSILQAFRADSTLQVLLTSEMGSEGIDLEFCNVIVNYDLPWNPMRIEQRVGRLDRINRSHEKINIWNLVARRTVDEDIYRRLLQRLDVFRHALGGLEEFMGRIIDGMSRDLLKKNLSVDERARIIDRARQAAEGRRVQEEDLEKKARHLIFAGDYIEQRIHEAKEMQRWVSGEDLFEFVKTTIARRSPNSRCRLVQDDPIEAIINLDTTTLAAYEEFKRQNNLYTGQRFSQQSFKSEGIRCLFDSRLVRQVTSDVEHVNHMHPFVRFLLHEAKDQRTHPVVACVVPSDATGIVGRIERGVYCVLLQEIVIDAGVRTRTQMYKGKRLGSAALMDDKDAEIAVNVAMRCGRSMNEERVRSLVGGADVLFGISFDLQDEVKGECTRISDLNKARYMDKLQAQAEALTERWGRYQESYQQQLSSALSSNEMGREGRVKAIENEGKRVEENYAKAMGHIDHKRKSWAVAEGDLSIVVIDIQ